MTLYYVNPTNTSDIRTQDLDGQIIAVGARVRLPINGGAQSRQWQVIGPVEQWDVYDSARTDTGPPTADEYYRSSVSRALEGPVQQTGSIVRETVDYTSWTIDEIAADKVERAEAYTDFVALQSVRSTSNNNFWIVLSEQRRRIFWSAGTVLGDRVKDRTGGRDSAVGDVAPWNTYWGRDLRILIIRDSNGQRLLSDVGEVEYGQAVKDMGLYDQQIGDANVAVLNDIETKRAAGVRADLVAIDVTAAVYGWPDYYRGEVSAFIRAV